MYWRNHLTPWVQQTYGYDPNPTSYILWKENFNKIRKRAGKPFCPDLHFCPTILHPRLTRKTDLNDFRTKILSSFWPQYILCGAPFRDGYPLNFAGILSIFRKGLLACPCKRSQSVSSFLTPRSILLGHVDVRCQFVDFIEINQHGGLAFLNERREWSEISR